LAVVPARLTEIPRSCGGGWYIFNLATLHQSHPRASFFCAMIAAITLKILDPFGTGKLVLFQVTYDKVIFGSIYANCSSSCFRTGMLGSYSLLSSLVFSEYVVRFSSSHAMRLTVIRAYMALISLSLIIGGVRTCGISRSWVLTRSLRLFL